MERQGLDPNMPVYFEFVQEAGFDFCDVALKKEWIEWLDTKGLPANAASLPVESIPFIPSPTSADVPLLLVPANFMGKDGYLPKAFRGNSSKLTELAKFNGALLLARLRLAMDRSGRFEQEEWSLRLRKSISITTIRDIFPSLPATLIEPTPASAYPMTTEHFIQTEHRRIKGVVDWIIATARSMPKDDIVTPMVNRLSPSSGAHASVRNYLNARRLRPLLPSVTGIITDLYVSRTATSAAARSAASRTLRPALNQLRTTLRELGEFATPMTLASWRDEEVTLVLMAITEGGGQNGKMTQEEMENLFAGMNLNSS